MASPAPVDLVGLLEGSAIEHIAKEHKLSPRQVVERLPPEMCRLGPASAFVDVMTDIAHWGEVTIIVHSEDGIIEFTGPVPKGETARGHYNLLARTGFHGHLRPNRCGGVAFIERPLMGRPSAAVLFFNVDDGIMFKIYVGRDQRRELRSDQMAAFRALAKRVCG